MLQEGTLKWINTHMLQEGTLKWINTHMLQEGTLKWINTHCFKKVLWNELIHTASRRYFEMN